MLTKFIKWFGGLTTGASLFFSVFLAKKVISGNIYSSIPWYWFVLTCVSGVMGYWMFKYCHLISRITNNVAERFLPTPQANDDLIQEEIRKRVLKAAKVKSNQKRKIEETQATLDALEEIVDIPREEMEKIAENVQGEFKVNSEKKPTSKNDKSKKQILRKKISFPWVPIGICFLTLSLIRRGSSWYIFTGGILVFLIVKLIKKYFYE